MLLTTASFLVVFVGRYVIHPFLVIQDRKAHPIEKKDVLNTMLYAKDPKTGKGLPEDNVMHNVSACRTGSFASHTW